MNTRAFGAVVRREIVRGKRSLLVLTALAGIGILFSFTMTPDGALIPGSLLMVVAIFGLLGPSAELGADKLQGNLEFDRALPMSHVLIAAGRLLGASIRMIPVGLCILPLLIGLHKKEPGESGLVLIVIVPLAVILLASMLSWVMLAINARWSLRGLRLVIPVVAFGPQLLAALLPPSAKSWIADAISGLGDAIVAAVSTPGGEVAMIVFALALLGVVFAGATMLFASGLERYRYDPTAINAMMTKAPRRELAAIGRGPLIAVARLRLRIAMDRSSQLLVIAGFVLALFVGPSELRQFARSYVRVLAVTLPWGIALQLIPARSKGYLEGMQHLPHAEETIGFGHLVAIAVMAIPATIVLTIARYSNGATLPTLLTSVSTWAWFVAGAWLSAAMIVWGKKKHMLLMLIPALALIGWGLVAGFEAVIGGVVAAKQVLDRAQSTVGILYPLGILALAVAIGLPLFARGLKRYEFRGV